MKIFHALENEISLLHSGNNKEESTLFISDLYSLSKISSETNYVATRHEKIMISYYKPFNAVSEPIYNVLCLVEKE